MLNNQRLASRARFVKRGSAVIGFMDASGPVYSFQGTLTGNVIQVGQEANVRKTTVGKVGPPYRLLPVEQAFEYMFRSLRIVGNVMLVAPNRN